MNTDLLTQVRRGLKAYHGSLLQLAQDAAVPYSWLCMFQRGKIPDPGILKIERLAKHFAKNGLAPKNRRLGDGRSSDQAAV